MYYVPMLKNKKMELILLKDYNDLFDENIIPLLEICKASLKKPKTLEEILNSVHKIMQGKKIFIDFFRLSKEKYKNLNSVIADYKIGLDVTRNEELYYKYLFYLEDFENFIPVLSLKYEFDCNKVKFKNLINRLQEKFTSIAFRVTDKYLEKYKDQLNILRNNDFLLYDIEEQIPKSKIIEIMDLDSLETSAKIIKIQICTELLI